MLSLNAYEIPEKAFISHCSAVVPFCRVRLHNDYLFHTDVKCIYISHNLNYAEHASSSFQFLFTNSIKKTVGRRKNEIFGMHFSCFENDDKYPLLIGPHHDSNIWADVLKNIMAVDWCWCCSAVAAVQTRRIWPPLCLAEWRTSAESHNTQTVRGIEILKFFHPFTVRIHII